jgi:hypothetical protein
MLQYFAICFQFKICQEKVEKEKKVASTKQMMGAASWTKHSTWRENNVSHDVHKIRQCVLHTPNLHYRQLSFVVHPFGFVDIVGAQGQSQHVYRLRTWPYVHLKLEPFTASCRCFERSAKTFTNPILRLATCYKLIPHLLTSAVFEHRFFSGGAQIYVERFCNGETLVWARTFWKPRLIGLTKWFTLRSAPIQSASFDLCRIPALGLFPQDWQGQGDERLYFWE